MTTESTEATPSNRRTFLKHATFAAAVPTAATLLGGVLPAGATTADASPEG